MRTDSGRTAFSSRARCNGLGEIGGATTTIIDLCAIPPGSESLVGGKAANLGRLLALGLPVPQGFCVPADHYLEHIRGSGLEAAVATVSRSDLAGLRHTIRNAPLAIALSAEITHGLRGLGEGAVAVRSSATTEDQPDHSFAGQHGTYFTRDVAACLAGLKHCWASLWTERAFDYRAARGIDHADCSMAVVVQSLVPAEASGVTFTVDPVSGRTDRVIVESCFGLGEALVSGKVSPDRLVFAADGLLLLEETISWKTIEILVGYDGRVYEWNVPPARAELPSLSVDMGRRVATLAQRAADTLGHPVDMEWAVSDKRVFVLQARPITGLPAGGRVPTLTTKAPPTPLGSPDVAPGAPVDPNGHPQVWSNVNAGEVLPGVVSPLTWSVVQAVVNNMLATLFGRSGVDVQGRPIVDLIAGRAYFNVTLLASAFRRMPNLASMDVDRLLGGLHDQQGSEAAEALRAGTVELGFSHARMIAGLPRQIVWLFAHSPGRGRRFVASARATTDGFLADALEGAGAGTRGAPEGSGASEDALARRFAHLADSMDDLAESIAYSGVAMGYYTNLDSFCRRYLPTMGPAVANTLLSGIGNLQSADAGLAMWDLAARADARPDIREVLLRDLPWTETKEALFGLGGPGRDYLAQWDTFMVEHGHHARGEIDLMTPRWSEQPDYVLAVVRSYLAAAERVDPPAVRRRRAAEKERLREKCRRSLRNPLTRRAFDLLLHQAQGAARMRENGKSEAVRRLAVLRWSALDLGRRLADRGLLASPEDVFFLTLDEIPSARAVPPGLEARAVVLERRAQRERDLALDPPPVVVGRFDPTRTGTAPGPLQIHEFTGLAVCGGVARGRARVIPDLAADAHVLPGEILVAPYTDPGWTPYFLPAAGIVVDMGGLLSHGSICAREYGIPAVVNVGPASKTIRTGQMLEVDGDRGVVRMLDKPRRDEPVSHL